jgi:hypothetical protein
MNRSRRCVLIRALAIVGLLFITSGPVWPPVPPAITHEDVIGFKWSIVYLSRRIIPPPHAHDACAFPP